MDEQHGLADMSELAGSVLLLDLQGPGSTLASRFRHRIAEVTVADERWLPLVGGVGSPHPEEGLAPARAALETLSLPDWTAPSFVNPAWRHVSHELLRLGYDPGIVSTATTGNAASAIAGALLWLSAHAVLWERPYSPPGLDVVSFGEDTRGGFSPADPAAPSPVRFHDAAIALGPSAVSSLAAVLARACGDPVSARPVPAPAESGPPARMLRELGGALRWVELAFLAVFDPYRSLDERGRAEAVRDVLLPAVRADFSYGVSPRSAAARARDLLEAGAPRI